MTATTKTVREREHLSRLAVRRGTLDQVEVVSWRR
jgi:hypothetical protein